MQDFKIYFQFPDEIENGVIRLRGGVTPSQPVYSRYSSPQNMQSRWSLLPKAMET